MVFDYYFAIVAITVFLALAILALVIDNSRINRTKKIYCLIPLYLLIFASIAEYLGVVLNSAAESTRFFHIILKVFELSISPLIVISLIIVLNGKNRAKKVIPIAIINIILQIYSGFTGFLYYFDYKNIYHHNTFYGIYTFMYVCCGIIFFSECIRFSRHYQNRNSFSLIAILIFLILGLSIHIIFSGIRADWLTLTIAYSLFYNYYNSLDEQTDSLTQLLDRKSYDIAISSLRKKATIIMLDADKFKEINDTYGHDAGDECLKMVAEAILRAYAKYGYCYRIGGDEFCVVIKKMVDIEAINHSFYVNMEQLRETKNPILPNVSLGYSQYNIENENIIESIKKADSEMYKAKSKNRSRKF